MNPELMARLRAMFAGDATRTPANDAMERIATARSRMAPDTPDWMQRMYTSPMADTTYQLAGVPPRLGVLPEGLLAMAAGATGHDGSLEMHPYRDLWDRAYNMTPADTSPRETFQHEQGHRYHMQNTRRSIHDMPEAKTERFADTFRDVLGLLSSTANDTAGYGERMDRLTATHGPMAMRMRDAMLDNPVMRQHPLRTGRMRQPTLSLESLFGDALRP